MTPRCEDRVVSNTMETKLRSLDDLVQDIWRTDAPEMRSRIANAVSTGAIDRREANLLRAYVFWREERIDDAIAACEAAVSEPPPLLSACRLLAELFYESQNVERAKAASIQFLRHAKSKSEMLAEAAMFVAVGTLLSGGNQREVHDLAFVREGYVTKIADGWWKYENGNVFEVDAPWVARRPANDVDG